MGNDTHHHLALPDEARELEALLSQIAWFNRLRLVVASIVLFAGALATYVLHIVADPWPLYGLGTALLLIDGIYHMRFRRLQRRGLDAVRRHAYLQIAIDLLILTALLHYSGGITNPMALFYLFHAFLAALALSIHAGIVVAVARLALLVGLGFAELISCRYLRLALKVEALGCR